MTQETLAAKGGPRAVPEGSIRPWPEIDEVDRSMVMASLAGGQHAHGPNCKALEQEFAKWNGNRHALTTNSGTAALHMALAAGGISAGDEVLVPAYSWPSSATCVLHHNAIPVFVDINFDTMNMDEEKIEAAITPKTRAVMAVHLHGLSMNMDRVMEIARRHGLFVVEDCCQAQGATWRGRKVGVFGHCAAFSFNQNKVMCSGEGGMLVTEDGKLAEAADRLRYFGESREPSKGPDAHDYALGWMYRNNDLTAAFGRAQLSKLDRNLRVMRENAELLARLLAGTPNLILPRSIEGAGHNWYNYTVRFDMAALGHAGDAAAFRDRLVAALRAEGVDTGVWQAFILPAMTVFRARNAYGHGCPWNCPWSQPVDYSLGQFPLALWHSDWHTGMTTPLRHPNGPGVVELVAKGIRKVMEQPASVPS